MTRIVNFLNNINSVLEYKLIPNQRLLYACIENNLKDVKKAIKHGAQSNYEFFLPIYCCLGLYEIKNDSDLFGHRKIIFKSEEKNKNHKFYNFNLLDFLINHSNANINDVFYASIKSSHCSATNYLAKKYKISSETLEKSFIYLLEHEKYDCFNSIILNHNLGIPNLERALIKTLFYFISQNSEIKKSIIIFLYFIKNKSINNIFKLSNYQNNILLNALNTNKDISIQTEKIPLIQEILLTFDFESQFLQKILIDFPLSSCIIREVVQKKELNKTLQKNILPSYTQDKIVKI